MGAAATVLVVVGAEVVVGGTTVVGLGGGAVVGGSVVGGAVVGGAVVAKTRSPALFSGCEAADHAKAPASAVKAAANAPMRTALELVHLGCATHCTVAWPSDHGKWQEARI